MNKTNMNTNMVENNDRFLLILPVIRAVLGKLWLIVLVAILFGSAAFVATKKFVTPTYRTGFTAYVNNRNKSDETSTTVSSSDLSASRYLVQTYGEILKSRTVLASASEKVGNYYSYGQLAGMISVATVDNTEIISVYVEMTDPQQALELAQAIAEVAPQKVATIVEGSSMQIIDAPTYPGGIYSKKKKKNAILGAIIGGMLVAVVVALKELLDDRVKDVNELEKRYGVTIIGTIPDLVSASKINYKYGYGNRKEKKK